MENGSLWKRPSTVPYPSIWRRFRGRKEIDGSVPEFWIQDVPVDQFEAALNFMMKGFPYDEPLNHYSNLRDDYESMNTLRCVLRTALEDNLALICYTENPNCNEKPIIAGVNFTHLKTKYNKSLEIKGKTLSKIFGTMETVMSQVDTFELLGTDTVLAAMGLYVDPIFRGQGLGLEIIKTRENLCKAVGIKASVTCFTATASQIIAEKAGYQVLSQLSYADLKLLDSRFTYPDIEQHTKELKYMYKLF